MAMTQCAGGGSGPHWVGFVCPAGDGVFPGECVSTRFFCRFCAHFFVQFWAQFFVQFFDSFFGAIFDFKKMFIFVIFSARF